MNLAEVCYQVTRTFPKEEMYGMVSQIRRSAASIPANIAEGYGREYRAEYIQFLRTAQGSLKELETHLILSVRVKLTTCPRNRPDSLEVRNFGEDATLPHPFPPEQSLKVKRILHSPLPTPHSLPRRCRKCRIRRQPKTIS